MKKTIIFDFDGVIVDSFDISFAVAKMVHPTLTFDSYEDKWNTNIHKAVFNEPEDTTIDFQKEYAGKMQTLKLSSSKRKVLEDLSLRFDFYIISSTNTQTIRDFCKVNCISQFFIDILGGDIEISKIKKFQLLFEKYKLNPKESIFVTDTVGDIKEAKKVDIGTIIAVTDGFQEKDILETANPDIIINSIVELSNVV